MCWCGVGDEGRPSLCLFYIRCLLVGDQVDDVVPRWAHGPFANALVLTVLEFGIVLGLCCGHGVFSGVSLGAVSVEDPARFP
jgi:hypothetical protein